MNKPLKILGDGIYLRTLTPDDASVRYRNWLNDPEVNQYLETRESTVAALKAYIKKQIDNPNSLFLGIFDSWNDIHIGNIKLEPISASVGCGYNNIFLRASSGSMLKNLGVPVLIVQSSCL